MDLLYFLSSWSYSYHDNTKPFKTGKYMYFPSRIVRKDPTGEHAHTNMEFAIPAVEKFDRIITEEEKTLINQIKDSLKFHHGDCIDVLGGCCCVVTCLFPAYCGFRPQFSNPRTKAFKKLVASTTSYEIRYREIRNEIFLVEIDLTGPERTKSEKSSKTNHTTDYETIFHYDFMRHRQFATGLLGQTEIDIIQQDLDVVQYIQTVKCRPLCCCLNDFIADEFYDYDNRTIFNSFCDVPRCCCYGCCYSCLYCSYQNDPQLAILASKGINVGKRNMKRDKQQAEIQPRNDESNNDTQRRVIIHDYFCCLEIPVGYHYMGGDDYQYYIPIEKEGKGVLLNAGAGAGAGENQKKKNKKKQPDEDANGTQNILMVAREHGKASPTKARVVPINPKEMTRDASLTTDA